MSLGKDLLQEVKSYLKGNLQGSTFSVKDQGVLILTSPHNFEVGHGILWGADTMTFIWKFCISFHNGNIACLLL